MGFLWIICIRVYGGTIFSMKWQSAGVQAYIMAAGTTISRKEDSIHAQGIC